MPPFLTLCRGASTSSTHSSVNHDPAELVKSFALDTTGGGRVEVWEDRVGIEQYDEAIADFRD